MILKLNPEHISTYSLIIEDSTKIKIKGEKILLKIKKQKCIGISVRN